MFADDCTVHILSGKSALLDYPMRRKNTALRASKFSNFSKFLHHMKQLLEPSETNVCPVSKQRLYVPCFSLQVCSPKVSDVLRLSPFSLSPSSVAA